MDLYTKLAQTIVYSSLWSEDAEICKLWITFLALKDLDGVVMHNLTGISRLTGISLEKCLAAVTKFESPDPLSTTPDEEGRRLVKLEGGGWYVVNHDKYQEIGWSEEKKEKNRERVRKFRKNRAAKTTAPPPDSPPAEVDEKYHPQARATLHILNEASGKHFRETDSNLKVISERLREKDVSPAGVKAMILRQCKKWKGTIYEDACAPATFFRKSKFDTYYANREQPIIYASDNAVGNSKPAAPVKGSSPNGGF